MLVNPRFPIGINPITLGNLPTSFDESMSYYEAILWLYKKFDEVKKLVEELKKKVDEFEVKVDEIIARFDVIEEAFRDLVNDVNDRLDNQDRRIDELTTIVNNFIETITPTIIEEIQNLFNELIQSGAIDLKLQYTPETERLDLTWDINTGLQNGDNVGF